MGENEIIFLGGRDERNMRKLVSPILNIYIKYVSYIIFISFHNNKNTINFALINKNY